jgi:peptidyl-prolyl isomerase G (cyclophilin G)
MERRSRSRSRERAPAPKAAPKAAPKTAPRTGLSTSMNLNIPQTQITQRGRTAQRGPGFRYQSSTSPIRYTPYTYSPTPPMPERRARKSVSRSPSKSVSRSPVRSPPRGSRSRSPPRNHLARRQTIFRR